MPFSFGPPISHLHIYPKEIIKDAWSLAMSVINLIMPVE